jgi:hypothetical protein
MSMVSGTKDTDVRAFKFATLSIIGQNIPLVLGVEPIRESSEWVDLLLRLKAGGILSARWDIRVCASLGGCSRLESVSPAELNDARLGQTAVTAILRTEWRSHG